MKAIILSIGDELLIGQVVNTNASTIASTLGRAGIGIVRIVTVGDDAAGIADALREAVAGADAVILTGGLGPTHDDVTKRAVAEYFGLPLAGDPVLRERIAALLAARGIAWSDAAEEQATVPSGAVIIPNRYGTAGGIQIERSGVIVIALPGVPYEMEQMLTDSVVPLLASRNTGPVVVHRTVRTAGISESALAARLDVPTLLPEGTKLAFLPSATGVRLRIDAVAPTREAAERTIALAETAIRARGGRYVYGAEDEELEAVVGNLLRSSGRTLACAESCTGGSIAKKITSVPGSSAYFLGSVVAYADSVKAGLLGVDEALIASVGAVSREVALAMAAGARSATGAEIGIGVTGIAGPGGGTAEKPVGTVWIAYADGGGSVAVRQTFGEGRERVVERATTAALELLRRKLLRLE